MATLAKDPSTEATMIDQLHASGAQVLTDTKSLDFYAHDIWSRGADLAAVVRPANKDQLAAAVGIATAAGHAVVPRGGGMSYTGGYTQTQAGAVLFDLAQMNRVLDINETDMTVTVEAGCTWMDLKAALDPHGLRTPMWGTLSGMKASVGGGMSQNGVFWGTARHGSAVDNCTALEVALADGTLLQVGVGHIRPYGPDLVGLFLADTGALGIKATITMRLVNEAKANGYATFTFDTHDAMLTAASAVARAEVATEVFGFDPRLNALRMKRESLGADAKQLIGMMKKQGGLLKGLKEGAKVALAGRDFLKDANFSLHVLTEGRNQAAADADLAAARKIAMDAGGREVENTIPKIIRANPFAPANMILGPDGERWAPIHGVMPHSRAVETFADIEQLYADNAELMAEHGIHHGTLMCAVGNASMIVEPCLYWPDARNPMIEATVEPAHLAKLPPGVANEAAWAAANELKDKLVDLFYEKDAVHFQIARTYRYLESLDPAALALLKSVKKQLDPQGLMNPGSLGLN